MFHLGCRGKRGERQKPRKRGSSTYFVRQRPFLGLKRPSFLKVKATDPAILLYVVLAKSVAISPIQGACSALPALAP